MVEAKESGGGTRFDDVVQGVVVKLEARFPCECRKANVPNKLACRSGRWSGITDTGCSKCVLGWVG